MPPNTFFEEPTINRSTLMLHHQVQTVATSLPQQIPLSTALNLFQLSLAAEQRDLVLTQKNLVYDEQTLVKERLTRLRSGQNV